MVMMNHDRGAQIMRLSGSAQLYPSPLATAPFGATGTETAGLFYSRYHSSFSATPTFRRSRTVLDRLILGTKTSSASSVTITIEGKTVTDDSTWVTIMQYVVGCDANAFIPNAVELGIAIDSHSGQRLIGFRAIQDKSEMISYLIYRQIH